MDVLDMSFQQTSLLTEPRLFLPADSRALLERLPRLGALNVTRALISSSLLKENLAKVALVNETTGRKLAIVMMCNQGHLSLARNALASLARVGLARHVMLFGISQGVCQELQSDVDLAPGACMTLPSVPSLCSNCGKATNSNPPNACLKCTTAGVSQRPSVRLVHWSCDPCMYTRPTSRPKL